MSSRRYIVATAGGAVLWVPSLVLSGFYGTGLLDQFPWAQTALAIASIVCFVVGTGYGLWRYRRETHRLARRPAQAIAED
jgi:membrane-associated protein